MMAVAKGWLRPMATPINTAAFGPNKTWRGVLLMPLFTILGAYLTVLVAELFDTELYAWLSTHSALILGIALGLGYIVMELPNSFIKRRLGIPAGEAPKKHAWLFVLIDQWDSAIGFGLVYWLLTDVPAQTVALMVLLFPLVALAVKRILFLIRWKEKSV